MESDLAEIFKWVATAFITLSAIQVSFSIKWATEWFSYLGFLIGHIIWSFIAVMMEEWALVALNISFIFVDMYAIHIRLNKKTGENNGYCNNETG